MTTSIEKVLAARDSSLTDENDWEEFTLTDVKARLPGKSRYSNILSASVDAPVAVTGQLEAVEEDQERLVLDQDFPSKRVIIENVTNYAYGQHDDGEVGIWVAGHAGWFSISPARGYKPMFNEMVESIDLLYFLADKHQKKGRKKNKWNPKVGFLFQEYIKHTNGACEDVEDSAEIFYKHHVFLITQMIRDKESVGWQETPIYSHFREKFPDVFHRLETTLRPSSNIDSSEERSETPMEGTQDTDEEEKAQAETIFEVILDMKEAGLLSKRRLNLRSLAETLLQRYEMSSLDHALDLVRARAPYVITMMKNDTQQSGFNWSRKVIHEELQAATNIEGMETVGVTPLQPRQLESDQQGSSSSDSEDEAPAPKGRRRRFRKSLLRPKLSSVSAKGTGKRNREPDAEATDSEAEAEDDIPDDTPSKSHGLQLVHEALSAGVNESIRSMHPRSTASSLNGIGRSSGAEESLELNNGERSTVEPTDDLIDLPPDTWVCPVPGCSKIVLKASLKRGKDAITDHSLVHADDTEAKLDLVLAEQRLNVNASVGNLINRIQGFNQAKEFTAGTALDDIPDPPAEDGFSRSEEGTET